MPSLFSSCYQIHYAEPKVEIKGARIGLVLFVWQTHTSFIHDRVMVILQELPIQNLNRHIMSPKLVKPL